MVSRPLTWSWQGLLSEFFLDLVRRISVMLVTKKQLVYKIAGFKKPFESDVDSNDIQLSLAYIVDHKKLTRIFIGVCIHYRAQCSREIATFFYFLIGYKILSQRMMMIGPKFWAGTTILDWLKIMFRLENYSGLSRKYRLL